MKFTVYDTRDGRPIRTGSVNETHVQQQATRSYEAVLAGVHATEFDEVVNGEVREIPGAKKEKKDKDKAKKKEREDNLNARLAALQHIANTGTDNEKVLAEEFLRIVK